MTKPKPKKKQSNGSHAANGHSSKTNSINSYFLWFKSELRRLTYERGRHYTWKYMPIAIMLLALSVGWLKLSPEGAQVESVFRQRADQMKLELDDWMHNQLKLYEAQIEATGKNMKQHLKETRASFKIHAENSLFSLFDSSSPSDIGWALSSPEHSSTKNRTDIFYNRYQSPVSTFHLLPDPLKDHIFVYIPGLFTGWYPGYMSYMVSQMANLGLQTFTCPINTAGSILENALIIEQLITNITIYQPDRKLVVIGHSKGALDAATAFQMFPRIIPQISAFIAFQAPWGGSAIANDILSAYHHQVVTAAFIEKILGGNPLSLHGVMYAQRKQWIKNHPFPLGSIPTISVATYETSFKSLLKAPIDYVRLKYSETSDGCVATKDAIIPGTVLVELNHLDHFGLAYHGFPTCCSDADPVRIQMALLNTLFFD